jgi:phenylalanyl-tRNA synthetase beta chain
MGKYLKTYEPASIGKVKNGNWELDIDVQDADACPRYMGVVMSGIDVGESPAWMKKRLMSVGVPSINNIVDITNYLLLELGQPMHAFDAGQLGAQENGISLIVRKAKSGEQFVALDEKEYELSIDDLVIATPTRAVAIAGVKGGLNSGITSATTSIVFESANFDAVTVRRTSTRLGLRTDASARYEKSLDPVQCELALRRAVELVREMCPNAVVSSAVVDQSNFAVAEGPIELETTFVRRKMGVDLPTKEMVRILESLGFGVKEKKDVLSVTVPSWRATKDIAIREDLVEEIARVYGYGNIPATLPTFPIVPPVRNPLRDLETTLRELLAYENGYTEVSNYSFVSPEWLKRLGIIDQNAYIALENPIAKDRPLLRRNLLPNMLQNVEQNLHRFDAVRLFEIGKTYRSEVPGDDAGDGSGALPKQDTILGCMYAKKGDDTPFFSLHGTLASVAERMGWTIRLEKRTEAGVFPTHPGRYATIYIQDVHVGRMGELHPQTADELGIPYRTAMMEINLSEIIAIARKEKSVYQPLSQYPVVERDIAFLVDVSVAHDDIATCLITADILTVKAELFDVFTGNTVPHGKKSMAYRLTYRSDAKTLETSEVETVHKKIIGELEKKFDAELR